MKILNKIIFSIIFVSFASVSSVSFAETKMRITLQLPLKAHLGQNLLVFQKELESRSDIKVEIYDSAQLYKKGTPIHVKGALIYNKMLKEMKLMNSYPTIKDGEKIKFAYLKKPNPVGDTVIAILNNLPHEFDLKDYIDYELQFNKAFIEPMSSVMNSVGWKTERVSTLEDFFG